MENKEYSNGEITILWHLQKCVHSGICVKTLPQVYNSKDKPWIKAENATSQELIHQVAQCPSGALSIIKNSINIEREDNGIKGRFAAYENGILAGEMTYTWAGTTKFIIDHTSVEENFEGKGIGKKLLLKAVELAREQQRKIIPLCPFAKAQFDRNKDIADVKF